MNILYSGDSNALDGIIISVLSLLKHYKNELNIYIFTMKYNNYKPLTKKEINIINKIVKLENKNNFVKLIDITKLVNECMPKRNLSTRFTPYSMLRLYADLVNEMPSKILYLDNDVVALKNPYNFYKINNKNYEVIGVLDYYGSHFLRKNIFKKDYINSGVLLLNLDLIRKTKLFYKARNRCKKYKMLMPDQTAINIYAKKKKIVDRIYNEQHKINKTTVFRHFTTTFNFFPFKIVSIKPWNINELHNILNVREIDDILDQYKIIKRRIK